MRLNRFMLAIVVTTALAGCAPAQPVGTPLLSADQQWAMQIGRQQQQLMAKQEADRRAQQEAAERAHAEYEAQAARKQADFEARMKMQGEADKREAAKSRPKCSTVRVSGIAGGTSIDLDALRRASDPNDLIARYPMHCQPSGMTQTYACRGGAWFGGQTGYVIAWSDTGYQIATPVDLIGGRKDALVFVRRSDSVCLNNTPPSLDVVENLHDFLRNHNRYR
ncbi:cell envelope integrity protein TolA [Burkholderia ambifaria]|jgi:hypothetical protein|uniref:cell envelope integrity protein TolA n=1 Tax=Burkholderia ambifaria TaxID=152480 RepID=UPI001BA17781|nr:cell envelope integrity protein TolA [Burkholderia ambifaria]MBR8225753.1 cell envelope integrity protein TolA [Burkholderia ambifaria]